MATDVAVPLSRLADCLTETKKELDASFLFAPIVGHVGDSNFHVCIMFDPTNKRENDEAHRLNRAMVYRAIGMEGTCTGEHGVGLGKKEYLVPEFGESGVGKQCCGGRGGSCSQEVEVLLRLRFQFFLPRPAPLAVRPTARPLC